MADNNGNEEHSSNETTDEEDKLEYEEDESEYEFNEADWVWSDDDQDDDDDDSRSGVPDKQDDEDYDSMSGVTDEQDDDGDSRSGVTDEQDDEEDEDSRSGVREGLDEPENGDSGCRVSEGVHKMNMFAKWEIEVRSWYETLSDPDEFSQWEVARLALNLHIDALAQVFNPISHKPQFTDVCNEIGRDFEPKQVPNLTLLEAYEIEMSKYQNHKCEYHIAKDMICLLKKRDKKIHFVWLKEEQVEEGVEDVVKASDSLDRSATDQGASPSNDNLGVLDLSADMIGDLLGTLAIDGSRGTSSQAKDNLVPGLDGLVHPADNTI